MSNIGKQFASEMERYTDKKSGKEVVQLTKTGTNWHLYFTDNSFTTGDKEIIYMHSDNSLREKANTEIFRLDLESGVRTQLTDFKAWFKTVGGFTKCPDSEYLVFLGDGDMYALNLTSGKLKLLYRYTACKAMLCARGGRQYRS